MSTFASHPTPHLLGQIDYQRPHRFAPDGDTIHLLHPLLLVNGAALPPREGKIEVWVTGATRPRVITVRQSAPHPPYVPVRLEGLDAPEQHYQATAFSKTLRGVTKTYPVRPRKRGELSQAQWKPATDYLVNTLQAAGWALVQLDREVNDRYGRVLGYVYASDAQGAKNEFVSLQLLRRGLAFPFLFESAGDFLPLFLQAAADAHARKLGVWRKYVERPLPLSVTAFARPARYTDPEPERQAGAKLNLPVVFRRLVEAWQLQGLSLRDALRKYDVMDWPGGDLFPGDKYPRVPLARRIWAPHRFG